MSRVGRVLPSLLRASTSTGRSSRFAPSLVARQARPSIVAPTPFVLAARSIQTTADATSLIGTLPESATEPFKIQLHPEYFQTHRCDMPSLEYETTKEKLVEMYKEMVTMRRMEMAADMVSPSPLLSSSHPASVPNGVRVVAGAELARRAPKGGGVSGLPRPRLAAPSFIKSPTDTLPCRAVQLYKAVSFLRSEPCSAAPCAPD